MPRKPRLFVPGAIYHAYCRVARGEFVFDDPADYSNSGHREITGHCPPRFIDIPSVLCGFDDGISSDAREAYLAWVRDVAEAKWIAQGLRQLPWWKDARDINEKWKISNSAIESTSSTPQSHQPLQQSANAKCGTYAFRSEKVPQKVPFKTLKAQVFNAASPRRYSVAINFAICSLL